MNYWLLTTEYPPLFGGGIGTYCHHTARMLVRNGHSVMVIIPDDRVKDHQVVDQEGVRIIHFNTNRTGLMSHLGHIARLSYEFAIIVRDLIRKYGKPDCIESQEYLGIPYYLLQFKLLKYPEFSNIPVILTLHSPALLYLYYNREGEFRFPNYWTGEMEMSCIRGADLVIAPSSYIISEIEKHFPVMEKEITVIRNPYEFIEKAGKRRVQRNKIVFFGKLSPQKGVFEMFDYLQELWDAGFSHPLTVIGGTDKVYYPEMKTMGQIIRDRYRDYIAKGLIKFVGKIPPSKRDHYLSDAHVILIPSRQDNLPYACIEAMSAGKVVLASRQGGQAEIINDGKNGFLFDHRDRPSFGRQLKHVLSLDDDSLMEIGNNAVQSIDAQLQYQKIHDEKMALIDGYKRQYAEPRSFPFTRVPYPARKTGTDGAIPDLLSIVIPYFNLGAYIGECVGSLLASGYKPLEILIVDDGSTDPQSIDALRQFAKDPAIKVLRKKNEGLALTRNYGASQARGEYLAFLDADDIVAPDYYSKAIRNLKQYDNVAFVGAWVQYFGSSNGKWISWNPEPPYILLHNSVNSSSLVYKKAAFLDAGMNDKAVDYGLEDYESVISMLSQGYHGVVLPEFLFFYRIRKDSMYRELTKYKALFSYRYISNKHRDFYNTFASQIFNLQNANGPSYTYDNPTFETLVIVKTGNPNHLADRAKAYIKRFPLLKKMILQLIKLRSH